MDSQARSNQRKGLLLVWAVLGVLILICFSAILWMVHQIHAPIRMNRSVVSVTLPRGVHARQIAVLLRQAGVNVNGHAFLLLTRFRQSSRELKSGDYLFEEGVTLLDVLRRIEEGRCLTVKVVIPEGYRTAQIARKLAKAGVIEDEEAFMKWAGDEALARSLGVEGNGLTGFLYPDGFYFAVGLSEKDVITIMVQRFFEVLPPDYEERANSVGMTLYDAVILASIVEKEAVMDEEREIISGVFHNRLRKGWRLQADPCVRFATQNFSKRLTHKHLRHDCPYNTYVYKGLPPGPICNPGIPSLMAAVNPSEVDFFFFVSMNNGRHHFSVTLEEHNKAVWRYQIMNEVGT